MRVERGNAGRKGYFSSLREEGMRATVHLFCGFCCEFSVLCEPPVRGRRQILFPQAAICCLVSNGTQVEFLCFLDSPIAQNSNA